MNKEAGLKEYLQSFKSTFKKKNCLSGACKAQDFLAKRGIESEKILSANPAFHFLVKTKNGRLISYNKKHFRLLGKRFKAKGTFPS